MKKVVLKNFANFIGKHLYWNLFLIKLQLYENETPTQVSLCEIYKILKTTILKNICERLLL